MTTKQVGKCSVCGGPVEVPAVWMGIFPPVPQCRNCGATKKDTTPVIEMEPKRDRWKLPGSKS